MQQNSPNELEHPVPQDPSFRLQWVNGSGLLLHPSVAVQQLALARPWHWVVTHARGTGTLRVSKLSGSCIGEFVVHLLQQTTITIVVSPDGVSLDFHGSCDEANISSPNGVIQLDLGRDLELG